MPFYVSPEQAMKDKAEYARKGIARGRSVVVIQYDMGILFVAHNPSRALHKISEIYDRIACAAVGRYNEFENLRLAGVRFADTHGYLYDRRDVTARALANAYAQTLGTIFTETNKPYEVELVVAEVGDEAASDQIYRLTFDGSVQEERGFVVMGGQAEQVANALRERHRDGMALPSALAAAVDVLGRHDGESEELPGLQLEVAVLDRARRGRKFRRLGGRRLDDLLVEGRAAEGAAATEAAAPAASEAPPDSAGHGEESGGGGGGTGG